ncbi:MAG: hypothetical protein EA397_03665, partial [Deltaproteobacteria bacterium]
SDADTDPDTDTDTDTDTVTGTDTGTGTDTDTGTVVCRVVVDGTSTGDGSNWAGEAMDLHSALSETACTELWLKAGVYKPIAVADVTAVTRSEREARFVVDRAVAIYGGFDGSETLRDARDPVLHPTILSGDIDDNDVVDQGVTVNSADQVGRNSFHVLWLDGARGGLFETTLLDGLTITGGRADDGTPWRTEGFGGGMYCDGKGGTCNPALSRVVFVGNTAVYSGGAVYNRGVEGESSPSFTDALFGGNAAGQSGGAMYNDGWDGVSSPTLVDVTFSENQAGLSGGAVHAFTFRGESSPTLIRVTFSDNFAGEDGGALANVGVTGDSSPALTNVTFTGNAGRDGGAVFNQGRSHGVSSPQITNVTFSGNHADDAGGAVYSTGESDGESTPNLVNVILWADSAGVTGPEIANETATPYLSYSILEGGCPAQAMCDEGTLLDSDPVLGSLQDNGGLTWTMAPAADGPAVDAGSDPHCPSSDQTGLARPQGAACDIGAVEVLP